ncbi:pentapeptide repeat-containing protein [Actinoplanes sp. NBRC 101535]|uniref:pentapeptide repeat-containing protein n=1 Tax=Actinoplanes sp. NBRC 101535 TaxID=3032196 RepID=UPI0024A5D8BF|nr:pentapeptide repeat-containing protein [Actinoplanes sp. NBRC 101535]GLY06650.1 hypothetical protein Acsp01_70290 [Actinoplanes sp. NBRC 101535]
MSKKALIDRWAAGEGAATRREISRRLADGTPLDDLDLPEFEGRADLRGLRIENAVLEGAGLVSADLSHASLRGSRIVDADFSRCRLDDSDLSDVTVQECSFSDCSIRRSDLRESLVADSSFDHVDFSAVKWGHFSAERSMFAECAFSDVVKADFTHCSFQGGRFSGRLREVRFVGRGMAEIGTPAVLRSVVFASGEFRYAEFDGMELQNVGFLESDRLIVIPEGFQAVAERAGANSMIRGDQIGKDFRRFLSRESVQRPGLSATAGWVVGRQDLAADFPGGEELATFAVETLYEAQRQLREERLI